jgi:hypothetical protein
MKAHKVVRRRGSQMAVSLSALRVGHPLHQGKLRYRVPRRDLSNKVYFITFIVGYCTKLTVCESDILPITTGALIRVI